MNNEPGEVLKPPKRARAKFGLGLALAFLAAILMIAAFVLIWFGVFPGLIALLLALPLGIAAARLMRKGETTSVAQH
ncbi:MAG TPA: hypothetical protein VIM73_14725 [Polyangiaceae bacterium]